MKTFYAHENSFFLHIFLSQHVFKRLFFFDHPNVHILYNGGTWYITMYYREKGWKSVNISIMETTLYTVWRLYTGELIPDISDSSKSSNNRSNQINSYFNRISPEYQMCRLIIYYLFLQVKFDRGCSYNPNIHIYAVYHKIFTRGDIYRKMEVVSQNIG